jgi:serine/threonine protein kinase
MTNEQWKRVKDTFDAALRRKPADRIEFLNHVCGTDETVRREVEALLSSFDEAGAFMSEPLVGKGTEPAPAQKTLLTKGQRLGHYEIDDQLGAGGMGEVYLARDTRLNRLVALKVLSASLPHHENLQGLWREARAAALLDHPNICAIHEIVETDSCNFIVMQYVKGETLANRLKRDRMDVSEILSNAVQIADALEEAHAHGVIHRDIKPANIIINDKGQVKVLDFGLAKLTDNVEVKSEASPSESSSKSGAIRGTLPFMSPEQVLGKRLDGRTDIFSFGAMLYEMACGRQAFARDTDAETVSAILRDEPALEEIPDELQPIVGRCLSKSADERYPSAKDLAADLRELQKRVHVEPVRLRASPASRLLKPFAITAIGILVGAAIVVAVLMSPSRTVRQDVAYEQLTNFTDSVVSPALSSDGKILAFLRSDRWFLSPGQIFVKMLPNGEPVQITHDPRSKYGPTFSPDGSRILYTVFPWSTYTVSTLGGEPTLFLNNSSGVTWLGPHRILFSEVNPPRSIHMGVVSAMEDRSEQRTIYFPQEERGMVHLSYPSPDRNWALVLEMNPVWQPCRVIPLDGSSSGRQVGPKGNCTSAAWSPDGAWMYFGVEVDGHHHLWRQKFPEGQPERITSGPTEEDGIAMAPDGRSLITSIGVQASAVWIHDARGDRPLSSQGYVARPATNGLLGTIPVFSRHGKSLFYLRSESAGGPTELWKTDFESEQNQRLLPGTFMLEFDISDDGKEVVYSAQPSGKPSQLWIASLDRSSPPQQLFSASGGDSPHFGREGRIVFRTFDGTNHYLEQVDRSGFDRSKAVPYPVGNIFYMSPDRRWITTSTTMDGLGGTYAVPLSDGSAPQRVSSSTVMWAPDGKFLYVEVQTSSLNEPRQMRVIPLPPGKMLPKLPPRGMRSVDDPNLFPGSYLIDRATISPSPDPSVYAYVKTTMHRNLFRIPLNNP